MKYENSHTSIPVIHCPSFRHQSRATTCNVTGNPLAGMGLEDSNIDLYTKISGQPLNWHCGRVLSLHHRSIKDDKRDNTRQSQAQARFPHLLSQDGWLARPWGINLFGEIGGGDPPMNLLFPFFFSLHLASSITLFFSIMIR